MQIEINGQKIQKSDLIVKIKAFGRFGSFLKDNKVSLPKSIRGKVLKEVLEEKVAELRKQREGTADDVRYRLGFFPVYSEFQLQNLLFSLQDSVLEDEYLFKVFLALVPHLDKELVAPVLKAKGQGLTVRDIDVDLNYVFNDVESDFDGLPVELLRPVLFHGSLNEEIRALGQKYDVIVPRRLKKAELIDDILSYFPKLSQHEKDDLGAKLSTMHPTLISRFAKDNNILLSQDLKKEEIIEYILKNSPFFHGLYLRPTSKRAYYLTREQKLQYNLIEARVYEDEYEETVPVTESTSEVVVKHVVKEVVKEVPVEVVKEVEVIKEVPVEVTKPHDLTAFRVFLGILLGLQIVALLIIILYLFI